MKPSIPKNIFLIFLLAAAIIGFAVFLNAQSSITPGSTTSNSTQKDNSLNTYTSKDLKISFELPKDWFIQEEDRLIVISNFENSLNKNLELKYNQIEITIDEFSSCFASLEEDLINPACGQGKIKNKIISKKVTESPGGNYLKLLLDSPDKNQQIQYFFQKEQQILQISKTPDPSQFEKEFEDLVNSIKFLD